MVTGYKNRKKWAVSTYSQRLWEGFLLVCETERELRYELEVTEEEGKGGRLWKGPKAEGSMGF